MPNITRAQLGAMEEAARQTGAKVGEIADLFGKCGNWPAAPDKLAPALVAAWQRREQARPWTVEEILAREG